MQRPQVDLAVKRRLKCVWVSIRVFYAKESANSLRPSALRAGGGKLPFRTHPPGGPYHSSNPSYATEDETYLFPHNFYPSTLFCANWSTHLQYITFPSTSNCILSLDDIQPYTIASDVLQPRSQVSVYGVRGASDSLNRMAP